jgi:hypothetical protein
VTEKELLISVARLAPVALYGTAVFEVMNLGANGQGGKPSPSR